MTGHRLPLFQNVRKEYGFKKFTDEVLLAYAEGFDPREIPWENFEEAYCGKFYGYDSDEAIGNFLLDEGISLGRFGEFYTVKAESKLDEGSKWFVFRVL